MTYATGRGADWIFDSDFLYGATVDCANRLWQRSSVTLADVDVAQVYDGFTPVTVAWIEALGACGRGEFGDWVGDGSRLGAGRRFPSQHRRRPARRRTPARHRLPQRGGAPTSGPMRGPAGSERASRGRNQRGVPAMRRNGIDGGMTESPEIRSRSAVPTTPSGAPCRGATLRRSPTCWPLTCGARSSTGNSPPTSSSRPRPNSQRACESPGRRCAKR